VTEPKTRWRLWDERQREKHGIQWEVAQDNQLPHEDNVEMSGRKVALIVTYRVNEDRTLAVSRKIIWPMLRTKPKAVRGYLIRDLGDDHAPRLTVNGRPYTLPAVEAVRLNWFLSFVHASQNGCRVTRSLFPSVDRRGVLEVWEVTNEGKEAVSLSVELPAYADVQEGGVYGDYEISSRLLGMSKVDRLEKGQSFIFAAIYSAKIKGEAEPEWDVREEADARHHAFSAPGAMIELQTPDDILNRAFAFAQFRARESIFDTAMGTVHSPGGGRYYGGVWANDQAEYSGPFFAFLGDKTAREAALTCYRLFAKYTNPEYKYLPSSLEVEGDVAWSGARDRGDAAMIAYGASRYALTVGDEAIARELRPLIDWCLEYSHRKTDPKSGVIASDSDELEGRFPSGKANLSTSSLAYGALRAAADLVRDLGDTPAATEYDRRADVLEHAIEHYFGERMEGYETYRYYEGNTALRAWICLPLTMGIFKRAEGTIKALFSPRLWTADGLATEAGDKVFWDRSTLYALRGVFAAGETKTALDYLTAYSTRRLLGDHVPYPVEAYPEGGQAHLSAESALYCRIFTEGIFGITPTGLRCFTALPRLPENWDRMALRGVHAFGKVFDVEVSRDKDKRLRLTVTAEGKKLFNEAKKEGEVFEVRVG
jgi:hypothetical protein